SVLRSSVFRLSVNSDTSTGCITLSLHDALPIYLDLPVTVDNDHRAAALLDPSAHRYTATDEHARLSLYEIAAACRQHSGKRICADRKSTRLNSSHVKSSYAVICLKKKNKQNTPK